MPLLSMGTLTFTEDDEMTRERLDAMVGDTHKVMLGGRPQQGLIHSIRSAVISDEHGYVTFAQVMVQL